MHFAHRLLYCYLEFKLRYLKNMKLFSLRVKELFEPILLRRKGKRRLSDLNFNYVVIDKISNFQEIAPNFKYIHKIRNF